jgi:Prealbumin-like fold domain
MTERLLGPTGSPRRKRRLLAVSALIGALMAVFFVAASGATLTNSSFNAGDGNLTVESTETDWANAGINCTSTPKVGCALDKDTGGTDDSFGQGTSENDDPPTAVTGSIPNNKSDLTRFYVKSSKENNKDFLYLAWERVQEPQGTTNMDFEFNQNYCLPGEPNPPSQNSCSSNGVTPNRSAGDILVKYDLSQGGSNPTLGYHVWITSGTAKNDCEAGNKIPCWGKVQSLAGNFEGAINQASTDDPINPGATRSLSARTFGEAAINLTDAGLFPSNQCKNFGSAYLKSRSSDSFTAEVKDFIAPLHVNISNCGKIELVKDFDAASPSTARANLFIKNSTNTTTIDSELNAADGGTTGENQVLAASYNISETAGSNTSLSNYTTTVACVDEANGNASVTVSSQVLTGATRSGAVSVPVGGDIKCTFTNTLIAGKIELVKDFDSNSPSSARANLFIKNGDNSVTVDSELNAADDGTTGENTVVPAAYNISETAGSNTTFDDYVTSVACVDEANANASVSVTNQSLTGATRSGTVQVAAGADVKCTFTNTKRTFTIVTYVCETTGGTTAFYKSNVTLPQPGGTTKATATAGPNGATAAQACGTAATFTNQSTGNTDARVNIGATALP